MKRMSLNKILSLALILGVCTGFWDTPQTLKIANLLAEIVIDLLSLISLPIIFFSLLATISGMKGLQEMRGLGRRVLQYTLGTTLVASTVAFSLYLIIQPATNFVPFHGSGELAFGAEPNYFNFVRKVIPSNIVGVFLDHNVVGILFLALLLSIATILLPKESKDRLTTLYSDLFAVILKVTTFIMYAMPFGVWAFVTLFMAEFKTNYNAIGPLLWYLACVVGANLIHGFIILPLFLKFKGVSPLAAFKGMWPALTFAFLSKSSNATLPIAMRCAEQNLKVPEKISRFSFPLCTTINMNGCAAFIFITVVFVGMSEGFVFSIADMVLWIFLATIAAVGNAGVPMGCYFLSSAFLAAMNIPLELMGVILPFYAVIDMVETALNVWSDSCISLVLKEDYKRL